MRLVTNSRPEIGAFEVLFPIMMLGLSVGATWAAQRCWRSGRKSITRVPIFWGPLSWGACVRASVLIAGIEWFLTALSVYVLLLVPLLMIDNIGFRQVVLGLLSLLAVAILLAATIALFNRPRSLVPPELRADRGALAELWRRHKHRRRKKTNQGTRVHRGQLQ